MLENRLIMKGDKLHLLCSKCGDIIGIYQANRGRPIQFCDTCIKKHRREKDKKYYEKTDYWSSPQYKRYKEGKREINKLNGKYPRYSQHIYRGDNGNGHIPNFQREQEIVRRMKNFTFKFGSDQVFGNFINDGKIYDRKIENGEDLTYHQRNATFSIFPIDNYECPVCKNEVFIKSYPIHSYDYNTDGFVMIHCANCGVVVE